MMIPIDQAATFLGMTVESVRYLARHKRIPAAKVGRSWRFHRNDLEVFIRSQYGTNNTTTNGEANGNSSTDAH
jgi:excisionase family DNA binding protein